MQLTPSTARGIAIRTHGSKFRTSDLYNAEINIRYGAWYLANLFHKYGSERLVLAAYNAGQGNVDRWRANGQPIQFPETAAYVERVEHLQTRVPARMGEGAGIPMSIDWAVELAENPNTYTPLGPNTERIVNDRYVLWMGRMDDVERRAAVRASRDDEIDEVIEEIRALLRERGPAVVRVGDRLARHALRIWPSSCLRAGSPTTRTRRSRSAWR